MSFRVRGLVHRYDPTRDAVLDGVSLDVAAGEAVAVVGPSGCGKSTLLAVLGLLWERPPAGGTVSYLRADGPVAYDPALYADRRRRAALRAADFGFVLQSSYLLPHFSGRDNIALRLAAVGAPVAAARRRADAVLARAAALPGQADLPDAAARPPRETSGGQRQRLAVLRAIAGDPRVLFADEPTSNLDPVSATAVLELLAAWRRGELAADPHPVPRTLLLVCHHAIDADRVAGRRIHVGGDGRLAPNTPDPSR